MSFSLVRIGSMVAISVWETEKIGIAITCSCIVMILFNRIHRYLPFLKCWSKDTDSGEVEKHTVRYVPDDIDKLLSQTRFNRAELKTLYRNFKNECPNGVAKEEAFKEIYCQFFPNGDAKLYAHHVFRTFEHQNEGYVNFEEFAICLSSLLRGSLEERLDWTFKLYDIDRNDTITKNELYDVIKSVYMLLGKFVDPPLTEEDYQDHTERIFNKLDKKGDGFITRQQFYESCRSDETIVQSMSVFDNAL